MDTQGQHGTHGTTILVVEDELFIRWAIADHLQECGYKVLTASTADEAIDTLSKHQTKIDLVFSDIRLPGSRDGFGLAAWLKEQRPEIPVILTSGHAQADDVAEELCEHVGEIVRKPYDFDALRVRIEQAISVHTSSHPGRSIRLAYSLVPLFCELRTRPVCFERCEFAVLSKARRMGLLKRRGFSGPRSWRRHLMHLRTVTRQRCRHPLRI